MIYQIVEKDCEEDFAFLHKERYFNIEQAKQKLAELKNELGQDYYSFLIVEVEE
jgi:hypothetical protein